MFLSNCCLIAVFCFIFWLADLHTLPLPKFIKHMYIHIYIYNVKATFNQFRFTISDFFLSGICQKLCPLFLIRIVENKYTCTYIQTYVQTYVVAYAYLFNLFVIYLAFFAVDGCLIRAVFICWDHLAVLFN